MQNLQPFIDSLQKFAQKRLDFRDPPKLFLKQDQENAKDVFGKTAYYDPNEKSITLFTTGRHPKDILRSFAHELVHHLQNERGDLMGMGATIPGYAQEDGHMREMEREAYEKGNMCFRDWEDGRKKQFEETNYKTEDKKGEQQMSYKNWRNKEFGEMLMDKWGYKPKEKSFLNEGMGTYDLSDADYKTAQLEEAPEELDEEEKEDALAEAHPMSTEAKEAALEDVDESALRDAVRDILAEMSKDN